MLFRSSVAKAKELWDAVDRPNLMIKVPGTPEGVKAFEELIVAGIQVNVTLLFAVSAYQDVARAYVNAIERRAKAGQTLDIASVASFFVSRIDGVVDGLLAEKAKAETDAGRKALLESLQGKAAIANAKIARRQFHAIFGDADRKSIRLNSSH